MTTQANLSMVPRVVKCTMTSRIRDFVRMNHPIFIGSKVGEEPQEFIDSVYKIVHAMGVTSREKVELASYLMKDLAQVWYTQWKGNRPEKFVPNEWEEFKEHFLGKYFPSDIREFKVEDFINLKQGNMSLEEYSLKFSKLSKYALSLVSNQRDEMSHFVTGVADLVREECRTTMLHDNMTVARLMVYAQSI